MTTTRIDRKTLKQPDRFQREARHLGQVMRDRWPIALGAALLVAALLAAGLWWQARAERREAEATGALAAAVATFEGRGRPGGAPNAAGDPAESAKAALPALRQVASDYQGTEAGATAQLFVAHALLRSGDARGAEAAYQAALALAPNDLARDAARLGLGHARLRQGNAAGAVESWRPLAEGSGAYHAVARLDLARAYEALGRPEEAKKAYADGTSALRAERAAGRGRVVALAEERLAALGGGGEPAGGPPAAK
jgi:tetratricopeptide (TPR) repeat protein